MSAPCAVYKAIVAVMTDMSKVGVGKNQQNKQQGFKYRGVDDVMNAMAPSLAKHGLIIVPRVLGHSVTERESKAGGTLFHVLLNVDFDLIASEDGSKHTTSIIGEAMDSGDKATNKAMAIAYKYLCFQTFCIPVDVDPDAETHEPQRGNGAGEMANVSRTQAQAKAREYANRFIKAMEIGIDQAVIDIHAEAIEAGEEFYREVWGYVPQGLKRDIKAIVSTAKEQAHQ